MAHDPYNRHPQPFFRFCPEVLRELFRSWHEDTTCFNSKVNTLDVRLDQCLELLIRTNRLPEAAFLARTYLPSQVSRVVKLWRESLSKVNQKAAESLADPTEYENLFPGLKEAFLAEQYLKETCLGKSRPATDYPLVTPNEERNVLEEASSYEPKDALPTHTQQTAEPEETAEVSAVVAAPVASVAPPQPEPAKKQEEDITNFREKTLEELEDDLDNLELDDIDTTDVNLDDDFLDD